MSILFTPAVAVSILLCIQYYWICIHTAHNNNIYYVCTYLIYDFVNYTRIVSISTSSPSSMLDTALTYYICIYIKVYYVCYISL